MRILKTNPILKLLNSYLIDSPQPSNLNYFWNFGSLLALCLGIQILSGVTLAMHYNPSVAEAFNSVEHIMRDVNNGWLIRYMHSNTASAFFFLVYLHIGRGLYYGSYRSPRVSTWAIGTIILIVMIATGFMGYVLPYGQMSLWGATVITNLMSAIPWVGQDIVEFIWGGLKIDGPYYGNVILKILLNAGKSPNLGVVYGLFLILILIISVKITMTWRQPAGVRNIHTSIASQRLHAGDPISKKNNLIQSINPNYVTGFSDGEATFSISILKKPGYKLGYQVFPIFSIQLHKKDILLLEKLKSFFNVGTIRLKKNKDNINDTVIFSVQSLKDITNSIIPHFNKYPLLTQKRADFILFKEIIDLMNKGKHLTNEGLLEIISIKASMNKGLNESLKKEFPNVIPVNRPEINHKSPLIYDNQWLVGFAEAEGCFMCLVRKNVKHKIGYQVTLNFTLTQHIRDLELMKKIKESLGLGLIYETATIVNYTITKKLEIDTIISMFDGKFLGAKNLDFQDFLKIQEIVNKDLHKTEEGLNQIISIKKSMNTGRKDES